MKVRTPHAARPTERLADAVNAAAVELWNAGGYDDAADLLSKFLDAGHPLAVEELLRTRNNLAMCERSRGRLDEACRVHAAAAHLADACVDPVLRGKYHVGLALTLRRQGRHDDAEREYNVAADIYATARQSRLLADVWNNVAVLCVETGRLPDAESFVARARSVCRARAVRGYTDDTLALVAEARGDLATALDHSAASLRCLRRVDEPQLLSTSVATMRRLTERFDRAEQAERLTNALRACAWNVTRAARLLGFRSREALKQHLRRHFPDVDAERRRRAPAKRNRSVPSRVAR